MNRILFIISFVIHLVISYLLVKSDINGSFWIVFGMTIVLVSLRRHYLKLKPFWDAPLNDIPKYFKKDQVYNGENS